jgi:hypothetical protein
MASEFPGTRRTEFAGYSDCLVLENAEARVVLGHQSGGRVLEYALNGQNVIYLDPEQNGKTWKAGEAPYHPRGGRFDVGPEKLMPPHPALWIGEWSTAAIGPRTARMMSVVDPDTEIQIVRDFKLDENSSRLSCRQTLVNKSKTAERRLCHWGRTLVTGGGLVVLPLSDFSRFPKKYVLYGPDDSIRFNPSDPNVRERDGYLEILGPPEHPKTGMDSTEGWLACLMPQNLMFLKSYATYPGRVYNEIAGLTVSVWMPADGSMIELEPIGPMETLKPGQSAVFEEEWWLVPFEFPQDRNVDLEALEEAVQNEL